MKALMKDTKKLWYNALQKFIQNLILEQKLLETFRWDVGFLEEA